MLFVRITTLPCCRKQIESGFIGLDARILSVFGVKRSFILISLHPFLSSSSFSFPTLRVCVSFSLPFFHLSSIACRTNSVHRQKHKPTRQLIALKLIFFSHLVSYECGCVKNLCEHLMYNFTCECFCYFFATFSSSRVCATRSIVFKFAAIFIMHAKLMRIATVHNTIASSFPVVIMRMLGGLLIGRRFSFS